MSFITTLFFAASSFGCHDPVSLSRLNLLPIPLILVATKFQLRHGFFLEFLLSLESLP